MKPVVLHIKAQPKPDTFMYVGRPSKWGNPFVIGADGTREDVIRKHREWLMQQPELLAALPELKGHNLACWCAPRACHADTLLELANESREPTRS